MQSYIYNERAFERHRLMFVSRFEYLDVTRNKIKDKRDIWNSWTRKTYNRAYNVTWSKISVFLQYRLDSGKRTLYCCKNPRDQFCLCQSVDLFRIRYLSEELLTLLPIWPEVFIVNQRQHPQPWVKQAKPSIDSWGQVKLPQRTYTNMFILISTQTI